MIQRYRPDSDEQGRSFDMTPDEGGDYVAYEDYEELEEENKRLREALDLVISFIPDGWEMPLGFNQVAQQAREALKEASHEG